MTSKQNAGGAFKGTGVANLQALGRAACLRARQARRLGNAPDLASRRRADERGRDRGLHGDGDRGGDHADGPPRRPSCRDGDPARLRGRGRGDRAAGGPRDRPASRRQAAAPAADHRPADRRPAGDLAGARPAAPYVYPVFGGTTVTDVYGEPTEAGGWARGAYVTAASASRSWRSRRGRSTRVGWNHAAGNKLWLRDGQGNEFLYTHLSAFSKLASNGAHVRAGQVIGFMGSTGTSAGAACAPLLRGAPRLDALPRPGRRGRPGPLPRELEAPDEPRAPGRRRSGRRRCRGRSAPRCPGRC